MNPETDFAYLPLTHQLAILLLYIDFFLITKKKGHCSLSKNRLIKFNTSTVSGELSAAHALWFCFHCLSSLCYISQHTVYLQCLGEKRLSDVDS